MFKNLKEGFGARLKELRKAKGYTQEKLAEKLDITQRQLTRIETGENFPSVETIEKISFYLEADLTSLFDFSWDKEYAVCSTGTYDKPVFEVCLKDDVVDLSKYLKKNKSPVHYNLKELINIQNSDESMLKSAKNINQSFTIVYKDEDGELSHIKTYNPDGTIDTDMSTNRVSGERYYKALCEDLKHYSEDLNRMKFVRLAMEAVKDKSKLEELKSLIKGIEIAQGMN